MDAMHVHVEALPSASSDQARKNASSILNKKIKSIVGVSTKVIVGDPGSVERSQGKARRVIDNR